MAIPSPAGRPKSPNSTFLVAGRAAAAVTVGALRPLPGNTVMRRPSRGGGGVGGPAVGGRCGPERSGMTGVDREDDQEEGRCSSSRGGAGRFRGGGGGGGESGIIEAKGRGGGVDLPPRPAARPVAAAKERYVRMYVCLTLLVLLLYFRLF